MPLLDHFHPPVSERRIWEGFHGMWAAALVEKLNRDVLGEEFYADMQVHIGSQLEVDVATFEQSSTASGETATLVQPWAPPATSLVVPTVFPDEIEVQVFSTTTGATLVGAIELVSPGNKDCPEVRRAFAAKCRSYLARGIGVVVVDIVTNRLANLHNELMADLGHGPPFTMPARIATYAVAYRPARRADGDRIEMWPHPLTLGHPLPELPLALRNAGVVPVHLEETYTEARQRSRLE
jgi:hypothetical protein